MEENDLRAQSRKFGTPRAKKSLGLNARGGHRPSKALGQNFLRSKKILQTIVRAGELSASDIVLEIGPGKGALTEELLASGVRVIAVEKDDRLIPLLSEKFAHEIEAGTLTLTHGDILKMSPAMLLEGTSYKLVANIPYYITGEILRKFLAGDHQPTLMVLLVQKEVAVRAIARNKKESLLSLSIKAFGTPSIAGTVPRTFFSPAPKVDSAILKVDHISRQFFQNEHGEKMFFELLHAGFGSKRKKLSSNLKKVFGQNPNPAFSVCGLDENVRAEDLALGEWRCLLSQLEIQK